MLTDEQCHKIVLALPEADHYYSGKYEWELIRAGHATALQQTAEQLEGAWRELHAVRQQLLGACCCPPGANGLAEGVRMLMLQRDAAMRAAKRYAEDAGLGDTQAKEKA
jgi:hypothetical protein